LNSPRPRTDRSGQRPVIAVHSAGGRWSIAVVSPEGQTLVEALSGEGDDAQPVAMAVERHRADRVVRLAPGREALVKGVLVPGVASTDAAAALDLMGEVQLPETLPPFRRAVGPVPDTGREAGRLALLTGWRAPVPTGESPEVTFDTAWTTEAAALAFLRGAEPGVAVRADPATGQVTMIGAGPKGVIVRSLIEGAESPAQLAARARALAADAAALVGAAPPAPTPSGFLLLPASRLSAALAAGAPADAGWIERHGLALGAALAALAGDHASRSLASLRERAVVQRRTILTLAVEVLSDQRRAVLALAAGLAPLLLGPWALGLARGLVLSAKSSGLEERLKEVDRAGIREAMHQQMESARWPMTKLLADFSRAAPVGVTVETVTVSPDQGLSAQGRADSVDALNKLLETLNATRVFTSTRINRQSTGVSGVEFQLTAMVSNPHGRAAAGDDFAAKPLAVRLYGEGASNTTTPVALDPVAATNGSSRASAPRAPRERSEPSTPSAPNPAVGGSAAGDSVPAPLTDEQIAAMDRRGATIEMVRRRTYPQRNRDVDAGVRSRLEDEVKRIQEHMKRLDQQPTGGGA